MAAQRHRRGQHRKSRSRSAAVGLTVVAVAAIAALVTAAAYRLHDRSMPAAAGHRTSAVVTPTPTSRSSPQAPTRSTVASSPQTSTSAAPTRSSGRPATLTRDGHWWGVDSSGPITPAALANVAGWYRGARPQFWGRYLSGSYAVSRSELAFARRQHLYVYLIVNDRNCSGCAGGDTCGNDMTSAQARTDAAQAVQAALRLGVPAGAVLFKDIEQVSSCRGEPTAGYLLAWYRALLSTRYRTGFYGNTFRPYYDFPIGYCAAVAQSSRFAADVVLDMNEPEPALGAPRGSTGPHNAPLFAPYEPRCTQPGRTVIWQYGESTDPDNLTDIDQAVPDVHGMLAPDGSVS